MKSTHRDEGAQAPVEVTPSGCNKERQRFSARTSLQDARDLYQANSTVDWHRHHITYEESPDVAVWVNRLKGLLWHGQMGKLFHEVRRKWPRQKTLPKDLRLAIAYLFRNRARMRYAEFRAQGYPTGSGTVESACKTVVQQRCRQSGMRWSQDGLQAILSLRCALLSGRWPDVRALL